ncbi:CDP-diacylglycerol diphosphatase [Mycolicibacterium stellerae]|uniref:CDP-diacylglycerol diphosphatase n=1 Tax=Mycolicibacterium stellerae TaxID=2358193 RepID=UPI001F31B79F|nr:CDP-diacylglycerol diphosphatase [Mycolicibacterium stellerae]
MPTRAWLQRVAGALAAALAITACAPQAVADPNALWAIVNGQCVPDQRNNGDPAPCALVDLDGGEQRGYAVLKDLVGATQFLLIPTGRMAGIESSQILAADAPNYFADAWRARSFVEQRAGRDLPRDWLSLAINSADARSQDQLHIHIDCVRADVRQALTVHADEIGATWRPFPGRLAGQQYRAMSISGDELDAVNPFRLLADDLPVGDTMGAQSLVVVGSNGADGRPGFVLLAGRADSAGGGHGEDLQDHFACPPPAEVMGK